MAESRLIKALGVDREPGQKVYRSGTHRCRAPQETLDWLTPKLSAMGITRVADISGLDRIGVPVTMVVRPNSRSLAVSQGKGLSLVSARVSGIMESVETYHAERMVQPLLLTDSCTLRKTARVVNTDRLPGSGERSFHDRVRTLWVQGVNLLDGERVWVPYEMVHTDYTVPRPGGSGYFPANTNGLASGNCPVEAIAHALYEVVERDAIAHWHQADSRHRRVVDLGGTLETTLADVLDRLDSADIDIHIWDATTGMGLPCIHCLLMGNDGLDVDPEFGSGCHPNRSVALLRAITEAIQARTTFISGSRDDLGSEVYSAEQRQRRQRACRALVQQEDTASTRIDSIPSKDLDTVFEDLEWSLQQLERQGVDEVIWIDLTLGSLAIPVARVLVPGLAGAFESNPVEYRAAPSTHELGLS